MNDPDHVYTTATYFNASYNNPKNGNNAFARGCYGHVAGAPPSTVASVSDDNVQTMTPPYGYTKLGGKPGIAILKRLFHLNQQIVALTDELKISPAITAAPTKEGFAQKSDKSDKKDADPQMERIAHLSKQIRMDSLKLNETIAQDEQLDTDEMESKQTLLYSRVKFGVAIVLGLFIGYLAYRFLSESPHQDVADAGSVSTGSVSTGSVNTGSVSTGSVSAGNVSAGSVDTGSVSTGSVSTTGNGLVSGDVGTESV